jgi:D-arabinose 1-dehydrogenase-like Zn-dependent alcohol dehydrogenase
VAVTSSGGKAEDALRLGASEVVDRTSATFAEDLRRATDGAAHLALDPTGAFWQTFADVLRPGGRLVIVGKMARPTGELRVQSLYWKQLDVLGSSMGSPADFAALLDHVSTHGWSPVVDSVYPLSRISDAYARLDARDRVGKVVLDVE